MKNKVNKKPLSKNFIECVAISDLYIETNKGGFNIKKGSSVRVSVSENNKAVIIRKGLKKEGKKTYLSNFYVEIKDNKILKDFLGEAVVLASELKNSVKEFSISKLNNLIVSESLKVEQVVPFLVKNKLVKEKQSKKSVFLPVKERSINLSLSQRVAKFDSIKDVVESSNITAEVKSIKYENSFQNTGYVINNKKISEEFENEISPEDAPVKEENELMNFVVSKLPEALGSEFSFTQEGNVISFNKEEQKLGSIEFEGEGYTLKDVVNEELLNEVLQIVMSVMNDYGNNNTSDFENDDVEDSSVDSLGEEMVIKKGDAEITFRDSEKPESNEGPEQDLNSNESDNESEEDEAKNLKLPSDEYIEM